MRDRLRWWIAICLAACCMAAGLYAHRPVNALADGVRVNRALLVGVDDFASRGSTYPSSTNNVFAMQEALQASRAPFDSIVIPDAPVVTVEMLTRLIRETFADADEDDVNYLYLSTHGEYDPDRGDPTLLLSDGATEDRLTPQALEAAFADIAGTRVLILDACYSGAFIGKGMRKQPDRLYFLGNRFKVLASSGAMEESWYWNTGDATALGEAAGYQQGAFYFTQALSQCLSPRYGVPADANRDGDVTLSELYNALLENHATSTPQVYPQEDDFVVFSYDPAALAMDVSERAPIGDVNFSSSTLSATDPRLTLEFTALRPVRVAYQIVGRRDGAWRFDEARLLYDTVEQYTAYGDERGAITPGRKMRTLSLNLQAGEPGGYVLVQLVSIDAGKLTVHAGHVIAIPPAQGDPQLAVETNGRYTADGERELAIFVRHDGPCELSVSILDEAGQVVRRLCHRQSTRPQGITPEGSTFYWNGLDKSGQKVCSGRYRVRVTGYLGEQTFSADSADVTLTNG
ncbi:MAG: caspase family protein [Candidatus Limiplasma sp.]|nr:caspase family protein [Candidatus Limiplasma sp.]